MDQGHGETGPDGGRDREGDGEADLDRPQTAADASAGVDGRGGDLSRRRTRKRARRWSCGCRRRGGSRRHRVLRPRHGQGQPHRRQGPNVLHPQEQHIRVHATEGESSEVSPSVTARPGATSSSNVATIGRPSRSAAEQHPLALDAAQLRRLQVGDDHDRLPDELLGRVGLRDPGDDLPRSVSEVELRASGACRRPGCARRRRRGATRRSTRRKSSIVSRPVRRRARLLGRRRRCEFAHGLSPGSRRRLSTRGKRGSRLARRGSVAGSRPQRNVRQVVAGARRPGARRSRRQAAGMTGRRHRGDLEERLGGAAQHGRVLGPRPDPSRAPRARGCTRKRLISASEPPHRGQPRAEVVVVERLRASAAKAARRRPRSSRGLGRARRRRQRRRRSPSRRSVDDAARHVPEVVGEVAVVAVEELLVRVACRPGRTSSRAAGSSAARRGRSRRRSGSGADDVAEATSTSWRRPGATSRARRRTRAAARPPTSGRPASTRRGSGRCPSRRGGPARASSASSGRIGVAAEAERAHVVRQRVDPDVDDVCRARRARGCPSWSVVRLIDRSLQPRRDERADLVAPRDAGRTKPRVRAVVQSSSGSWYFERRKKYEDSRDALDRMALLGALPSTICDSG